jgi:hypothetical protein
MEGVMADLKTQPNETSVEEFLKTIADEKKREDSFVILEMMKQVTQSAPRMWGSSIVGFGDDHYKYESGREGDWFRIGFSPRKQALTVYLTYGFDKHEDLLQKLGKHKTGKACLYIKRLSDIDETVLRELMERSFQA